MRLLEINSVCGIRSTGRIVTDIAVEYEQKGWEVKIAYGREIVPAQFNRFAVRIGNDLNVRFNALECRLLDNDGFTAKAQTKKFLEWANEYNPDELWLHNLHGYYVNIEFLFRWIKARPHMKVKWTLHDCWAFTGHCSHFSYEKCNKWKESCLKCALKKEYPSSFLFDNSKRNFEKKRCLFTGVNNLTLVTPSRWLKDLVKQSFLNEYDIEVKHNTVDTKVFKPTPSDFRERYGLENKKIVLGVASAWGAKKGLYDFYKLYTLLPNDYSIVLVGLSAKQIRQAPKGIVKIPKTNSKEELAQIYSAADVFLNPSKEETFGLTTLEAIRCGTEVIVLKGTSCEELVRENGGLIINDNINEMVKTILDTTRVHTETNQLYKGEGSFPKNSCINFFN